MASNEFSLFSLEGLSNSSDHADEYYADEETQEAYAYEPLADAEWLALYEQERRKEEELEKTLQKRLS